MARAIINAINGYESAGVPFDVDESNLSNMAHALLNEIADDGGGGGTSDYNALNNKPKINGATLAGDKSPADLGLATPEGVAEALTGHDGDPAAHNDIREDIADESARAVQAETGINNGINAETTARAAADLALGSRIDGLETLGHYVGSFDNYETPAEDGNTIVPANKSDFPNGITINDFVTVRADETHEDAITRYVAEAIDADTGGITWAFDFAISGAGREVDVSGKADKVASAVAGNLAKLTAGGNLEDSGIPAADVLALLADKSIPLVNASALTLAGLTAAFTAAGLNQQGKFAAVKTSAGIVLTYLYSTASGVPSAFITFGVRLDLPGSAGKPTITSAVISDDNPTWTKQVQADWNMTDTADPSFIKNKPVNSALHSVDVSGLSVEWVENGKMVSLFITGTTTIPLDDSDEIPVSLPTPALPTFAHLYGNNYNIKPNSAFYIIDGGLMYRGMPLPASTDVMCSITYLEA